MTKLKLLKGLLEMKIQAILYVGREDGMLTPEQHQRWKIYKDLLEVIETIEDIEDLNGHDKAA